MGTYEELLEVQHNKSKQEKKQRSTPARKVRSIPDEPTNRRVVPPASRSADAAPPASTVRNSAQPNHRRIGRRSFEFYLDQLDWLRNRSLKAQIRGEKLSMSDMMRTALDSYIHSQQTNTESDEPTSRLIDAAQER